MVTIIVGSVRTTRRTRNHLSIHQEGVGSSSPEGFVANEGIE